MGPNHHSHRRIIINGLVVLLIIAACVAGFFYYHNHKSKPTPPKAGSTATNNAIPTGAYAENYTADKLVEQKFNPAPGQGVSFELPNVILATGLKHSNWASYYNYVTDPKSKVQLTGALVYVFSNAYGSSNPKPDSTALAKDLANSSSDTYKAQTTKVQSFLTSFFPTNDISILSAQAGSSNTTLIYNYDAPLKAATISGTPTVKLPNYQGKFVYIYGNNASYYFIIKSIDYNLQNNASTWQKVIDSIKVDQ